MDPMGVNIIGANTTLSCVDFRRKFDATRKLGMKYIGFGARRDHNFFSACDCDLQRRSNHALNH